VVETTEVMEAGTEVELDSDELVFDGLEVGVGDGDGESEVLVSGGGASEVVVVTGGGELVVVVDDEEGGEDELDDELVVEESEVLPTVELLAADEPEDPEVGADIGGED